MEEQPAADDVYQNGKRAIADILLDDDAGSNKRLCVGAVPWDEWGDLSTQSWMNQTSIPESAFLSEPLEQPAEPYSWNYLPIDQSVFPASHGFKQLTGSAAGEFSLPGSDVFSSSMNGVGLLPPIEANAGIFCDYQYAGTAVLEQTQIMEDVDIETDETPVSNWLSEPTKESSAPTKESSAATTPLNFATPVLDEKPSVLSSREGTSVEPASAVSTGDVVTQPLVECDVCFGVIVINALSSAQQQKEDRDTALVVSPCGSILKLSFKNTGKYAGIINSEPLARLLQAFSVQITATMQRPAKPAAKPHAGSRKAETRSANSRSNSERPVRLVVCGLTAEKDAVRDLMSENELFFQHPLPVEVTSLVSGLRYFNPHLLVRPGSQMPDLASLSLSASSDVSPADVLDDVSKARLMRVFDMGSDPTATVEVKPSPRLKTALKSYRHRITGIKESSPRSYRGGILGDEMGLGKTLSTLALLCWSLDSRSVDDVESGVKGSRQTLIITPKSTLPGWQDQIRQYIKKGQLKTTVFHGSNRGKQAEKLDACDVVFTTYQTLRSDWSGDQLLYSKPWTRVVLDEAHHIRTRSTDLFQAACDLEAPFRWCLTGTPIHNSLGDYASLVSFVGVEPFASKSAFDRWIAAPLKCHGKENLRNLEHLVKATCLCRTKEQLVRQDPSLCLPSRTEKVEWIDLSPDDREIYEFFKARTAKIAAQMGTGTRLAPAKERGQNIICLVNFLRLICGHGQALLPSSAADTWKSRDTEAIDWQMMKTVNEKEYLCRECGRQRLETPSAEVDDESLEDKERVHALVRNLLEEQRGNRHANAETTKSRRCPKKGFVAVRIDGRKSLKDRKNALSRFKSDPTCTVMLVSIGSAGEGVDFTSATCVHLLEPHWNPMVEAQAVDRVHRIGQHRPVTTTRYVTRNSIETVHLPCSRPLHFSDLKTGADFHGTLKTAKSM
ncbi:SNF2 family N-terminal domain containing protein [Rhypophila sp. PSN 637]